MKKRKKLSGKPLMKERLKFRIMLEKGYTEMCAEWMVERLEQLMDHMLYGHAAIAYKKQNGEFRLVMGTLIYYERTFGKAVGIENVIGAIVYWDVDVQGWRSFQAENFLEWRPIV